ncbi:MAG: ABC transporter permease [Actinomycetota bacterium]
MWKATVKSLRAHKLRLGLSALAVVLGVGFITGTNVLADTVDRTFDQLFEDVNQGIDVFVRSKSSFETQIGGSRQPFDDSLIERIRGIPGVKAAAGSVQGIAQIIDAQGDPITTGGAPTIGASWAAEPQGAATIRRGQAAQAPDEVMIDARTATERGLDLGDRVRIITVDSPREYEITAVVGFGDADSPAGATLAIFDLRTAQEVLGKAGKLDSIDIAAAQGVSIPELIERISDRLPVDLEAVSGARAAQEQSEAIKSGLGIFNTVMRAFAAVALFVGAFIIFNTFSITVAQRTRELGLLRALGAGSGQVTGSILLEALIVGVIASAVGILAGVGIALLLGVILSTFGIELPSAGLVLLPRTALVAGGAGVGITVICALLPARRAARISPMAALRGEGPGKSETSRGRTTVGLGIIIAGLAALFAGLFSDIDQPVRLVGAAAVIVFLGVAVLAPLFAGPLARAVGAPVARFKKLPGKLARQNAARNLRRTASTAAALMIGLALVSFASVVGASLKASTNKLVDESLRADYTVTAGSLAGLPVISPEVTNELYDLPEVAAVAPIRLGEFKGEDGRRFFVVGTDPDALEQVADPEVLEGDLQALDEGGLLLHRQVAADLGIELGDQFTMQFPATGDQQLEVVGIFGKKAVVGSDYLVALSTYNANFPERTDAQLLVKLNEGVSKVDGDRAMDSVAGRFPNIAIDDRQQSKERTAGLVNNQLGLVSAMLGLALIIALLGITNTLALSVFERTRELGLLRAVGMGRAQARTMVRWEAVIIAIIGAALGLPVGVLFGWATVAALEGEGITELEIPIVQLAAFVLAAGVAGVLAALPPARRAARLNVLEAISAE